MDNEREPSFLYVFFIVWKVFWSIALIAVILGALAFGIALLAGF